MSIYVNMKQRWDGAMDSVDVSVLCSPLPGMVEFQKDLEACPCFCLGYFM